MADAKSAIIGFNNTFFKVKLQLIQMQLKNGLGEAISEMIANIKKLVSDIKPTLKVGLPPEASPSLAHAATQRHHPCAPWPVGAAAATMTSHSFPFPAITTERLMAVGPGIATLSRAPPPCSIASGQPCQDP